LCHFRQVGVLSARGGIFVKFPQNIFNNSDGLLNFWLDWGGKYSVLGVQFLAILPDTIKVTIALMGTVPVKATAENKPIQPGDLLTTGWMQDESRTLSQPLNKSGHLSFDLSFMEKSTDLITVEPSSSFSNRTNNFSSWSCHSPNTKYFT